jgi:hypothetical protein
LDILREKALLSTGLEDKLKKALQKASQVDDLKKQIKNLEDQNDRYLKQALDAGMLDRVLAFRLLFKKISC